MAAGEHGDREAAGVERVDQIGEQLAGGAGVGIEKRFTTRSRWRSDVRRAPVPVEPVEPLPRTIILRVRQTMRRSIQGPALRTYQVSSASFSSTLNCWPPCTWAQPVMPGRIAMRSETQSGWSRASSGRGPMNDMSPRTTLKS